MLAYKAVAIFLVAGAAGYLLMPVSPPSARRPSAAVTGADRGADGAATIGDAGAAPVASGRPMRASRIPAVGTQGRLADPARPAEPVAEEGTQDPTLDLSHYVPPGAKPTGAELIEALHEHGIYEGIGAFPPPGTDPPKVGLAVPEDFPLPEGYVRHHQSTDDGQAIEPILMFSPDYEFFDENGQPIPIPEDRVVPPHLAPPGLPIRDIEIPQDRDALR